MTSKLFAPKKILAAALVVLIVILLFLLLVVVQRPSNEELVKGLSREPVEALTVDLRVLKNGDVAVVETIQAVSVGERLKHGIVRVLPKEYIDEFGEKGELTYEAISAIRNGETLALPPPEASVARYTLPRTCRR